MDFLDSIEREWSREKSLRMRSWYLYEQFKDLERSQTVAAELMRSRTEQDRFLRQELSERRERRRLNSHYSQPDLIRPYSQNSRHSFDNLHQLQYTDFPPSDDYHQPNHNNSDLKELIMYEKNLDFEPHVCPKTISIPSLVEKELNFHDFQDGLDFTDIEEQCQNLEDELNADSILSYAADVNINNVSLKAIENIGEEQEFDKNSIHLNNLEDKLNADSILELTTHLSIKGISREASGLKHIAVIKEEHDLQENDIEENTLKVEAEINAANYYNTKSVSQNAGGFKHIEDIKEEFDLAESDIEENNVNLKAKSILNLTAHSSLKSDSQDASGFKRIEDINEELELAENDIQDRYLDAELNIDSNHIFSAYSSTIPQDASFTAIEDIREELELVKNDIQDNITIQNATVLDNLHCYSNFERIQEDENFLENDKLGDESLQIEDVSSQEEFDSMSETSIVDRQDVYKDFSKHSLWSKIVSYAYHLVQLKHENVYNDYGAQILTAVLVCDMLRRGITRLSDLLQRYVSPIKYEDVTDHGWQTSRPSEVAHGCAERKFGAGNKRRRPSQNVAYTVWSPRSSSTKLNSPTCKSSKSKGCSSFSNDSGIFVTKFDSWHPPYIEENYFSPKYLEDFSIDSELNSSRTHVSNPMSKVAEYIDKKINQSNCDENL